MNEIDLIPSDYRQLVWLRASAKRLASVLVLVLVTGLGGFTVLGYVNKQVDKEVAQLKNRQQITSQQQETLDRLNKHKAVFDRHLALLNGLRGGTAAPAMFKTIDQALVDDSVWFLDWEFRRAGHAVEHTPTSVETGYFIVLADDGNPKKNEAWMIETHMTIRGQAKDHAALSQFVRRLFELPEIQDIRILNTSLMANTRIVTFDLAVTVNTAATRS